MQILYFCLIVVVILILILKQKNSSVQNFYCKNVSADQRFYLSIFELSIILSLFPLWNKSMFNAPEKTFHAQMKTLLNCINYDLEHIAAPCVLYWRLGIRVLSNI